MLTVNPQPGVTTERRGSVASLLASCALLAVVLAAATAGAAWWASSRSGSSGAYAALLAGGVCLTSSTLALTISFLGQRFDQPIAGVLGGMIFRLGLPLAAGLAIQSSGGPLAAAGCFGMIVALYLVALPVETLLSLKFVPQTKPKPTAAVGTPTAPAGMSGH
jgi:hypothetical protein